MTFLLLIINTLVFLTTSGGDEETLVNAVEAYETEQILGTELPLFQAYLTSESDGPAWPRVPTQAEHGASHRCSHKSPTI